MKEWGPAVLRLVVGVVFVAHGVQKLFGAWGGGGLQGTADFLAALGWPAPFALAVLVAVVETLGGALLIVGAYTRGVAAVLALEAAVAIWQVHLPHGFFLNWGLVPGVGHGYEYALTVAASLVSLLFTGAGALSVDAARARAAEEEALGRARLRAKVN
jgi:putative oxidoreductase